MTQPDSHESDFDEALYLLNKTGGFTYDPINHRFLKSGDAEKRYAVSTHPERGQVVDALTPTVWTAYIAANIDLFTDAGQYFGGWQDGNKVYLDVSTLVWDEDEARRMALGHGQARYYSFEKGESVSVQ